MDGVHNYAPFILPHRADWPSIAMAWAVSPATRRCKATRVHREDDAGNQLVHSALSFAVGPSFTFTSSVCTSPRGCG